MTLSELAAYICSKVGQTDTDSVTACKSYLRRAHQMIWDSGSWKEALFTLPLSSATGLYVMPDNVDQIVSARILDQDIRPLDQSILNRAYPGLTTSGYALGFVFLPPTCVAGANVSIVAPFGTTSVVNIGDTFTLGNSGLYTGVNSTGFVGGFASAADVLSTLDGLTNYFYSLGGAPGVGWRAAGAGSSDKTNDSITTGTTYLISRRNPGSFTWNIPYTVASPAVVRAFTTDVNDTSQMLLITGQLLDGSEMSEVIALTGYTGVVSTYAYANVSSVSLDSACTGTLYFAGGGGGGGSIRPGETSVMARPRVQVLGYSTDSVEVTFLCKRKYPGMSSDSSTPALRNCENVLLAFGQADMLERQRQYGKSQLKIQEGQTMLSILLDLERNQSASEARVIPEDVQGTWNGYGVLGGFDSAGRWYF